MRRFLSCLCVAGFLTNGAFAQQVTDAIAPEGAGAGVVVSSDATRAAQAAKAAGQPVEARDWMVAAANPYAVEAGARVLDAGGTAADALVAVQLVLGLVEPQSSGLGGGAFLVWYDAGTGDLTTLDGRETAPLSATPQLFQDEDGQPLAFFDAVLGGRSVGVPGVPALLQEAHERWGNQPWKSLFVDAIGLAEGGFPVSARMAMMVEGDADRLGRFAPTREYFLPGGVPLAKGDILTNKAYAETLWAFARNGADVFYSGEIAAEILATVQNAPGNPGGLAPVDMAIYRVKERPAVCAPYRLHEVCGMGPPSSGALAVGQILGLLDGFDMGALGPDDPQAWRLFGEASRLAFADRGQYVADSDFVPVPVKGMLEPSYLAARAAMLQAGRALEDVEPGTPEFDHSLNWGAEATFEQPSTTHISIVDRFGNVAAMTSSVENAFGSRLMVGGFLLNNQLTDFSFRSQDDGRAIANAVAPGKRPRSSMSPTIVLKDGAPVLVLGSPGGSRIIPYVAKTIIAHLDWGMDVQKAVALPHVVNRFGSFDLEEGTAAEAFAPELEALGFEVSKRALTSGLQAISIGQTLQGGADPRREGIALGQ